MKYLIPLLLSSTLCAVDSDRIKVIQFSGGVLPNADTIGNDFVLHEPGFYDYHDTTEVDASPSSGFAIGGGIHALFFSHDSLFGFGVYAGAEYRGTSASTPNGNKYTSGNIGVNVGVDLTLRPAPDLFITVGPRVFGGIGQSEYKITGNIYGATADSAASLAGSLAIQMGIYYVINDKAWLGVEGGIMQYDVWSKHNIKAYDSSTGMPITGDDDITVSGTGMYGNLVIGFVLP